MKVETGGLFVGRRMSRNENGASEAVLVYASVPGGPPIPVGHQYFPADPPYAALMAACGGSPVPMPDDHQNDSRKRAALAGVAVAILTLLGLSVEVLGAHFLLGLGFSVPALWAVPAGAAVVFSRVFLVSLL